MICLKDNMGMILNNSKMPKRNINTSYSWNRLHENQPDLQSARAHTHTDAI